MKILVSGSTGLIGKGLVNELLRQGFEVGRLLRNQNEITSSNCVNILWDPVKKTVDTDALNKFGQIDYGINLAGYPIGSKRWNSTVKDEILNSRISATQFFVELLHSYKIQPTGFLSASAIGIYGNSGNEIVNEESNLGSDFLAEVCLKWESAAASFGSNTTFLRSGIVLSKNGGALMKQLGIFKIGLGGPISDGKQWLSWISLGDEVQSIIHCMTNNIYGQVNLTSPGPVTNLEFTKTLGEVLKRPTPIRVPKLALKAILGPEMAKQLVLASQRIMPIRLIESGFKFSNVSLKEFLTVEFNKAR